MSTTPGAVLVQTSGETPCVDAVSPITAGTFRTWLRLIPAAQTARLVGLRRVCSSLHFPCICWLHLATI
ncbi:hypothetical protein GLAREA_07408 [Glarea lozoyensis ATCC 20868]|uniref:Uncharacterized protein n=1 Tax=Glarea lozoyensis (strain ATCC 20868 / MF5171) TaxID=1116229 RepID=S3D3E7_GLAL2|nr:uncharacterized protein GLAREA_07408 [Glarea lozoyensis ATCC 20868]EPE32275.1 hypothetical protein GLAREA_07408 [Glarea lozoyensis ATCC 20868]